MGNTVEAIESAYRVLPKGKQYCYHAIIIDFECSQAEEVVWKYNKKGQMKNIIKELKIEIGMESLPCENFGANSFWFLADSEVVVLECLCITQL